MPYEAFEPDDPMELTGQVLPGEPGQLELMAECLIEEYIRLGWTEARLMTLFDNPMFLATHRIFKLKGEAFVRGLIQRTLSKWGGGFHFAAPVYHAAGDCSLIDPGQLMDSIDPNQEAGHA